MNTNKDPFCEILSESEVAELTGFKTSVKQQDWLHNNGWAYHLNGARRPIIGRLYARMKMAGNHKIDEEPAYTGWKFDLSKVS
ncbi:DUF4224 domain-containing protein [Pseudomonas sp. F1_0610]|uniref:DUF4224 domain-containing protein n=1 Tax=Pseudomonas sp. F1_0610 TaxID=3114284 RepID=UPI0039C0B6B0